MQARGPLMIEHRLIERMLNRIEIALIRTESTRAIDPVFIDTAVDFIRIYADRTHHGKEENILFRELDKRRLVEDHRRMMADLVDDHIFGRKTTQALVEANTRYRRGDASALPDIIRNLRTLIDFYPGHIAKEDKIFFPEARSYFSDMEDKAMLAEFYEFDRKMIHEKYRLVIESLEKE